MGCKQRGTFQFPRPLKAIAVHQKIKSTQKIWQTPLRGSHCLHLDGLQLSRCVCVEVFKGKRIPDRNATGNKKVTFTEMLVAS